MSTDQVLRATAAEAADRIHKELAQAAQAVDVHELDAAIDSYVRALGLALQLGPAPTEGVLAAILHASRELALHQDSESLAALGPALVGLVNQVHEAGALPPTATMEAWAVLAADLGALIGQLGLALAIPLNHRAVMLENARQRASLLDESTGGCFALTQWFDDISDQNPDRPIGS